MFEKIADIIVKQLGTDIDEAGIEATWLYDQIMRYLTSIHSMD